MELKNLLDVCTINDKSVNQFGGYKEYIATGDIDYNKIVNSTTVDFENKPSRANRYVENNDIVFAKMKETVKVLQITEEISRNYIFSTGFSTLKTNNKKILANYLYYILISDTFQKQKDKYSSGATQKAINNTNLKKIKIPVPSLEVQKQIVEVLDNAQALIDNRKAQIEYLDDLIESIFYTMFGDPVKNEKGWKVEKLGKLGVLERGKSKHRPRDDKLLYGDEYPFIQTGDVAKAGLYLSNYNNMYSEKGLEQSKLWTKDTLCITIAANIAKTTILNIDACFPDSIVGFIPNNNSNIIYIRTWFEFLQKTIEEKAPKSAQRNINLKILNNLDVITPSVYLQNKFAEKVEEIEEQKNLMESSLELLEENYNSIMDKAFSGDLFN